jgi:transposase
MPTHPASPSYQYFVGVDIAAKTFTTTWTDGSTPPRKPATFAQSLAGYQQLQERLAADGATPATTLIVLEVTSSYWVSLAVALHEAGYRVAVVNPAHVHNYAKSLSRRAKTDKLDAILLTQFAMERRPTPWMPPPQVYHELRQRLTARDALVSMHTQAKNHLHALLQWPVESFA